MESRHSLLLMHWDHELTPYYSQEGSGQDAGEGLLPSWELSVSHIFLAGHRDGEMTLKASAMNRVACSTEKAFATFLVPEGHLENSPAF